VSLQVIPTPGKDSRRILLRLTLRSAIKSSSRERTKDPGCWLASRGVLNRRDGATRTPHHRGSREPWAVRAARRTLALDRLRSPG